jgi:hypothetical protein
MRSVVFAATLAALAGFAVEPQRPEDETLTREQLIEKIEELNAVVSYVSRTPGRPVTHVAVDETWKGGDEGIAQIERLARIEEGFRALYIVGKPPVSASRIKELQAAIPDLRIERRGASYLGVAGGSHPEGVQLIKVEPRSPADKAGLRDWDIIAEFDGAPVDSFQTLATAIAAKQPGDTVEVKFFRGEEEHTTKVTFERWTLRPPAGDQARRRSRAPGPKGFGHVEGRFLLSGEQPEPTVIVEGGRGCGPQDILDESLVVDSETKGIANIFIYLRPVDDLDPGFGNPPDKPVVLQIENCTFKPHALLLRAGEPVIIKSKDPMLHEIHFHPLFNQEAVAKVDAKQGDGVRLRFEKSEILPTKFNCDVHPHMVGYALMLSHPYASVTDPKGRFRIENLPAGEHRFTVWHERVGYLDRAFEVTVEPNQTTALEPVEVPADALRPRSR